MTEHKMNLYGVDYIGLPEPTPQTGDCCKGCAFNKNEESCSAGLEAGCSSKAVIWVLDTKHKNEGLVQQENKYTVEQVVRAVYNNYTNIGWVDEIVKLTTKRLEKGLDPEYAKYLELKKKYEGES